MPVPVSTTADPCGPKTDIETEQNEEKKRMESFLRREIRTLHRSYRKLQEEEFTNKVSGTLYKHHLKTLKQLKEEKQTLLLLVRKVNVSNETMKLGNQKDKSGSIEELMDIYNAQASLVEDCIAALREISYYVNHIVNVLAKHKQQLVKHFGNFSKPEDLQKKQDILEKNLCLMTTKYNTILSSISKLKVEIQGACLVERSMFFKRMKQYKYAIEAVKGQMNIIVHKTNQCYDKYDDAKHQQRSLFHRHDLDSHMFINEMKENVRFLKNDRYIRKFVDLKNKIRPSLEEESQRVRRRLLSLLENTSKLVPQYKKAFKLIADVSGSHDTEFTKQTYLETDIQNFVAFRQLSELSECIESITREIEEIRTKIVERQAAQSDRRISCLRKLKQEKDKNSEAKNELIATRQQLEFKTKEVTEIIKTFDEIFNLAGASRSNVLSLFEKDTKITAKNIFLFLKTFEFQILNLIRQKEVLSVGTQTPKKTQEVLVAQFLHKNIKQKTPNYGGAVRPSVVIPSTLDANDVDEEERLFSKKRYEHHELRKMCMEVLLKSVDFINALTHGKSTTDPGESAEEDNVSLKDS